MPDQVTLSPRVAQAWDIYSSLPEGERSYKAVAEAMKVTVGRSADYCRKAAVALGKEDMLPRGSNGGKAEPTPTSPVQMMQAETAKLKSQIEQAEARIEQAKADAEAFDVDAWRKAEEAKLADEAKAATQALKDWRGDTDQVATDAAKAQAQALTERATKVEADSTATIEKLKPSLEAFEQAIKGMTA